MGRVNIFGNSVGYGLYGREADWSHLLKIEAFERRQAGLLPRMSVLNASTPGTMLTHIIESGIVPAAVNCNRRGRQIGIFCVGACESSILWSQGQSEHRRSMPEFEEDLEKLAVMTKEHDIAAVYVGATPVDDKRTFRTPEGDQFCDASIIAYDGLLAVHAAKSGSTYVDMRSGFDTATMLAEDGLHLNEAGNHLLYERTRSVVFES